jgi:hypothetical protein
VTVITVITHAQDIVASWRVVSDFKVIAKLTAKRIAKSKDRYKWRQRCQTFLLLLVN